ncbi:MAG: hypothetical protein M3082_00875 [Candidatus Dormibacteraeota bacterium]|nr:hypothetical protein [Candidatus Dormibacteraeota bacterium]
MPALEVHVPGKRWGRFALVGAGVSLVAIVGALAFLSLTQGVRPLSSAVSLACSPQPCLDLQDYTMWVSNVTEADGVLRMDVTFRNSSASTHADPSDLELVDANKDSLRAIQDAARCTHWTRTEFGKGAKLGPLTICFRPHSTASPLRLHWTPDMGLLCCEAELKIR